MATNRLQTELMQLMTSPAPGVSAFPSADGNLLSWRATIEGPDETPYAGLTLKLSFEFPANYPYAPPTVLFRTPIYHPTWTSLDAFVSTSSRISGLLLTTLRLSC